MRMAPAMDRADLSKARHQRRFTMADLMIVVVGLAVAFGLFRSFVPRNILDTTPGWLVGLSLFYALMTVSTPTLLVLRLLPPRPPLRQLARQPGFAASVGGSISLLMTLLAIAIIGLIRWIKTDMVTASGRPALTPRPGWWLEVLYHFDGIAGPVIIGAWVLLALSGRRRPVWNWLDLLGRAIGTVWALFFVVRCCGFLFRTIE